MSTTMQSLIMDTIEAGLGTRLVTIDHQYANAGVIRVLDDVTQAPRAEAWFNFTDEGCTFKASKQGGAGGENYLASCYYEPGRYKGSAPWTYHTPAQVIDVVVTHLRETGS